MQKRSVARGTVLPPTLAGASRRRPLLPASRKCKQARSVAATRTSTLGRNTVAPSQRTTPVHPGPRRFPVGGAEVSIFSTPSIGFGNSAMMIKDVAYWLLVVKLKKKKSLCNASDDFSPLERIVLIVVNVLATLFPHWGNNRRGIRFGL